MRTLGIDHGERRVGLALSSDDGRIALPLRTLDRTDPDALLIAIRDVVVEHGVTAIVVGLPLTLEGREGASARRARRFAERLAALTRIDVSFIDERMTSVAAERSLSELGVRGGRRKEVVDQVAAALLLQTHLDQGRESAWHGPDEPSDHTPLDLPPREKSRGERGRRRGKGSRAR